MNEEIECFCHFSVLTKFLRTIEKSIFVGLLVPVYFVKYGINIWSNAPIRSWFWCHKWQVHFLGNFSVTIDIHRKEGRESFSTEIYELAFQVTIASLFERTFGILEIDGLQ